MRALDFSAMHQNGCQPLKGTEAINKSIVSECWIFVFVLSMEPLEFGSLCWDLDSWKNWLHCAKLPWFIFHVFLSGKPFSDGEGKSISPLYSWCMQQNLSSLQMLVNKSISRKIAIFCHDDRKEHTYNPERAYTVLIIIITKWLIPKVWQPC